MPVVDPAEYILIPKRRARQVAGASMLALALAITFHALWLPLAAQILIVNEPPQKADAIVVLGGGSGDRERKGAELFAEGYAPLVMTTGEPVALPSLGSVTFASLSAADLEQRGVPADKIVELPQSMSTCDDARFAEAALPAGAKRVIVVTDPYHTRRAKMLFERSVRGVEVMVVASDPPWFDVQRWWTGQDSLILIFQEYIKFAVTLLKGCE